MQPMPPIRTLEHVSRPKSLVEAIRNVYGPGYLPHLSRVRLVEGSRALRQISNNPAPSFPSEACEVENDLFDEKFNSEFDSDEDHLDDGSDIIGKRQQPAVSGFSFEQQGPEISSELETQNDYLRNNFSHEVEEEDKDENWEGFEDTIPAINFDIPPPPIASFDSGDLARQSVQKWAQEHGYALRTRSSKRRSSNDAHPYRIYLECDRGGRNKGPSKVDGKQLRKSSTRRRECLFRCLVGQPKKDRNALWTVQHSEAPYNVHNHGPSHLPTAHPIHRRNARKSRPEILCQIQNNRASRIPPKDTLLSLQNQFPDAPLTLRDIENVYSEVKKAMNHGLPAVQAMISKLGEEFQFHYVLDDHERLERVLFFHNDSLQLLRLFPKSYVLDATYQTNRFNSPLLDIVGFTATNSSFIIGQAFLTHEAEEDYIWVLQ